MTHVTGQHQDHDPKPQAPQDSDPTPTGELDEMTLTKVSGGAMRRGGDDDLDDLEVER